MVKKYRLYIKDGRSHRCLFWNRAWRMRVCSADRSRLMSVCTVSITEKPIPKTYPALWCILGLCLKVVHEVTNRFVNPLLEKCIFESLLHLLKIEAMGIFYRQSLVLKQNKNKTTKCYFCCYKSVCDVGYSAAGWKYRYIQIYTYCRYHLHYKSLTTRRCFNLQQFKKLKFSFLINYWNEQIDITIMCFF